ncbi:hypothetical protein H0H92_009712 [Tricholoma furcatifolium]|nr:hypothetical protein H0H92_009712 [Tricholoma furcatifolium]
MPPPSLWHRQRLFHLHQLSTNTNTLAPRCLECRTGSQASPSYGDETRVLAAHYEEARALGQEAKRLTLKACEEDKKMTEERTTL